MCSDPVWFEVGDVVVVKFGAISAAVAFGGLCVTGLALRSVGAPVAFIQLWIVASVVALLVGSIVVGKVLDLVRARGDGRQAVGRVSFTFFGGFLGVTLVTLTLSRAWGLPFGRCTDAMLVAVPFFHGLSRLACLNYGCCFGRRIHSPQRLHTVYHHPRSKPVRTLGLHGVPLYPVPLYEIAGNIALGLVTVTLWFTVGVQGLVSAAYLIGYAVLRCIADHYRHEAHHEQRLSYRVYQWCLAASFVGGGIAFGVVGGLQGLPLGVDLSVAHLRDLAGIAPLALLVSGLMGLAYGVHVGEVGRWFGPVLELVRQSEKG